MKLTEKITKLEYRIVILNELLSGDSLSEQTREVYKKELSRKTNDLINLKDRQSKPKTGKEKQITIHDISLEDYAEFKRIIAKHKIKHDRNITHSEMFIEFMKAWKTSNENEGRLF